MQHHIFKFLFPRKHDHLKSLEDKVALLERELSEAIQVPKPSAADLMRDNLKLVKIAYEFDAVDGFPLHPMATKSEEQRGRVAQSLMTVFYNPEFQSLIEYLINYQVNYTMRKAVTDEQIWAARFTINGIATLNDHLKSATSHYEEMIRPPDKEDDDHIISTISH